MGSQYLLKPLRTLREACREIRVAHPELPTEDCDACLHGALCAILTDRAGPPWARREDENETVSQSRLKLQGHAIQMKQRFQKYKSLMFSWFSQLAEILAQSIRRAQRASTRDQPILGQEIVLRGRSLLGPRRIDVIGIE